MNSRLSLAYFHIKNRKLLLVFKLACDLEKGGIVDETGMNM